MRSLIRALQGGGRRLEVPWPSLSNMIEVRPGILVVVLAAPNVGKSLFGLNWAINVDSSLIYSLDTDPRTQAMRMASNLLGRPEIPLERAVRAVERRLSPRWYWEAALEEMPEQIAAEKDYFGQPPSLVVVDNMEDVVTDESSQGYNTGFRALKSAARRLDTVVLALHHVHRGVDPSRDITGGDVPVWLRDANFAGERQAAIVLSLWRPSQDTLRVAVLKNRFGPAHSRAHLFCELGVDLPTARIYE